MLEERRVSLASADQGEKRGCETRESLCALGRLLSLAPPKEMC